MGDGDRPYRLFMLLAEGAGEGGAFDPEKEDRRDDDCGFSLSSGGGGNIEVLKATGGNEGVEATEVAGVSGAVSLEGVDTVEKSAEEGPSSFTGTSLATDSASLVILSRLSMAGRLSARPPCFPSLTVLAVLACRRARLAVPKLRGTLVLRPMA
jgi:hypothetical protein